MYKGVEAYAVLCWKPAIQFTIFEKCKKAILITRPGQSTITSAEAFIIGMVARAVATVIVFPYIRGKVLLQSVAPDKSGKKISIPEMMLAIYEDEGLAGIFKGIGPELTRGVLSAAIMLTVREKIYGSVEALIKGKTKKAYVRQV